MQVWIEDFIRHDEHDASVGLAHYEGHKYRFVICNSSADFTRFERYMGDDVWASMLEEPPFSLRVLVKHRLAGFC